MIVREGTVSLVECKSGSEFGWDEIKALDLGIPSQYSVGSRIVLCLAERVYPVNDRVYAVPFTAVRRGNGAQGGAHLWIRGERHQRIERDVAFELGR